jgi:DNA-binding MarR family transcriptional regulator
MRTRSNPLFPELSGWLRIGVMWQLMEHGTASQTELTAWLKCRLCNVSHSLFFLIGLGLVQTVPNPYGLRKVYGLTPQGIDIALHITPQHWQAPAQTGALA